MYKKFLLIFFMSLPFTAYSQYDMSYLTFTKYLQQELTEDEFRSIDEYFDGNINGIVCYYDYGEFSNDTLDELVILTYEGDEYINVYVFHETQDEKFEFADKVRFRYWQTRYEVSFLIKDDLLFITSTDNNYLKWVWNAYHLHNGKLTLVKREVYQ